MYGAREAVGWWDFPNCIAYLDRFLARPAVQVGLVTPPRD
jgi:GST-like protein